MEVLRQRRSTNWVIIGLLAAILTVLLYSTFGSIDREAKDNRVTTLEITSPASLVHSGSHDSFATTKEGVLAGKELLNALEDKDLGAARRSSELYDRLIPKENYGGEYTALQWFDRYLLGNENVRAQMLKDKYAASFYKFFGENDYARLKEYLQRKYKLGTLADRETEAGNNRKAFLEDFILFNNPRREEWENTSQVLKDLNLRQGLKIADIGSGPGSYSFRFSELVGDKGLVYAIDTVKDHLDYVDKTASEYGVKNIKTIHTNGDSIGLGAEEVDYAFMCSLYHNIYGLTKEDSRATFVNNIKRSLKTDGKLFIVDNDLVKPGTLPYHGPYITEELIIGQLKYYGFEFVKLYQPIPQRYILEFKKA
jgi:SAM-dependent methyltransferase